MGSNPAIPTKNSFKIQEELAADSLEGDEAEFLDDEDLAAVDAGSA